MEVAQLGLVRPNRYVGMEPKSLLQFLRQHRLAVQSSVSALNHAQAAVVGFAVSEAFEIIFDTLDSTRKVANLRANPRIALVIWRVGGWRRKDRAI